MQEAQLAAHRKKLEEDELKQAEDDLASGTNRENRVDLADLKNQGAVDIDDI
jgi:hypothetical protein